jgi:hypothetical protein
LAFRVTNAESRRAIKYRFASIKIWLGVAEVAKIFRAAAISKVSASSAPAKLETYLLTDAEPVFSASRDDLLRFVATCSVPFQ